MSTKGGGGSENASEAILDEMAAYLEEQVVEWENRLDHSKNGSVAWVEAWAVFNSMVRARQYLKRLRGE